MLAGLLTKDLMPKVFYGHVAHMGVGFNIALD